MVHVNPNVVISMGKRLKSPYNTNHSAVFFHFCCNDILFNKNSTPLKVIQIGAVGELV
jgi:hypothetical protein